MPIKCPELFKANGKREEGVFSVILGPRLMEALQYSHLASKAIVVIFLAWGLEEYSIGTRMGDFRSEPWK